MGAFNLNPRVQTSVQTPAPSPWPGKMTIINDRAKAQALNQELSALLDKGAIEPVDPLLQPGGFHMLTTAGGSTYNCQRRVVYVSRPEGCLLPHPYSSTPSAVFAVCLSRVSFPVPSAPIRSLPLPSCVMAALSHLQSRGMKILPYLDDWLICAPSQSQLALDTSCLLSHVARLGLRVNFTKSFLVPSQGTFFLGMTLDAITMKARPSPQRVDDILRLLLLFREGRQLRPCLCDQTMSQLCLT